LSDAKVSLPPDIEEKLIRMANEMGLWGISIPEELSGISLSTLGNCLVEEELAQTVIPFDFGDVTPILFECNDWQKESYFLSVLHRQKGAYLALMEPGKGADFPRIEMKAEKVNGHYVLDGKKVSFSRLSENYFAVVFATTGKGITCFLVDKDTPGFNISVDEENAGWRTQVREPVSLIFEHCKVPVENVLGKEGKAFNLGKKWLPARRIARSARCVGVAQRILKESALQAKSWQSFGQFVFKRMSIQAALADMVTAIHACRLMIYEAACKADKGESIRREAVMVKLFATETLNSVADRAAHVFNGPPHTAGLTMEALCRNALVASNTELALELQRSIIAQDILRG
jgi:acyl-CoA dehydrogenase